MIWFQYVSSSYSIKINEVNCVTGAQGVMFSVLSIYSILSSVLFAATALTYGEVGFCMWFFTFGLKHTGDSV